MHVIVIDCACVYVTGNAEINHVRTNCTLIDLKRVAILLLYISISLFVGMDASLLLWNRL